MDPNKQKEEFSVAYAQAVATVAGCTTDVPRVDIDSVDMIIRSAIPGSFRRSQQIDAQLKCTAQEFLHDDYLHYPLKRKNYNDLIGGKWDSPKILVVMLVPEDVNDWLRQSEEELALRRCGYWMSLRDFRGTPNKEKVTVKIPRSQTFSADALRAMMQRIADGVDK